MDHEAKAEAQIDEIASRTARLEWAVFGVDGKGGILDRLDRLDAGLRRVLWALVTAALTFAVGASAVVITTLSQGHP